MSIAVTTRLHQSLPGWHLRERVRLWWCGLKFASPRGLIKHRTMLSTRRLVQLERSARAVVRRGVAGDFVECGCAQGGSAALLALCLQRSGSDKRVYLFDT